MNTHPVIYITGGISALLVAGAMTLLAYSGAVDTQARNNADSFQNRNSDSATFIRVVDGNTIAVKPTNELPATNAAGTEHDVRLLGIEVPKTTSPGATTPTCGAATATEHLAQVTKGMARVRLSYDPKSSQTTETGMSLAYVEGNNIDLGLNQIQGGYATASTTFGVPSPTRIELYKSAEQSARVQAAGNFQTCVDFGR